MNQNATNNNAINPLIKNGTNYVISGSTMANEYITKLIEAYNASLLLDRSWEKLKRTSQILLPERPDYYKESIDLFVIKMLDFELTRRKYLEQIETIDDAVFDEIRAQVERVLEAWKSNDRTFQAPIPTVTNSAVKTIVVGAFNACELGEIYEELFGLYAQSLSEEKRNELGQTDTEKKLLDNVRQTRKSYEQGYEENHSRMVSSIQKHQFFGDSLTFVYSQLEKGMTLAKNELKNLGVDQQLDPHHRVI